LYESGAVHVIVAKLVKNLSEGNMDKGSKHCVGKIVGEVEELLLLAVEESKK